MITLLILLIIYFGVFIGMRASEYTIPLWICFSWPVILIWLIVTSIFEKKS